MVKTLPRTFCQWKSPPKLICSIWISFDRKISVDPPSESSLGWLKLLTKSVSNRISGVKNLESHTASLLRALPLSQVQSANANGVCVSTAGAVEAADVESCGGVDSAGATASAGPLSLARAPGIAGDGVAGAAFPFSCDSSCSMRAFIAASSLATSADTAGFGAAAGRVDDSLVVDAASAESSDESSPGSCTFALFV